TNSGEVYDVPGETWSGVNVALHQGCRGLAGGSSLAKLLAAERGVRNSKTPPPLAVMEILAWADAHYQRTGKWPTANSGPIETARGETWLAVNVALQAGRRDLPGGSSLANLLQEERGARNIRRPPRLT